jgi:hypothetical protein
MRISLHFILTAERRNPQRTRDDCVRGERHYLEVRNWTGNHTGGGKKGLMYFGNMMTVHEEYTVG